MRSPAWSSHAESVDVSGKLQIKPGQSVALLNPPPGMTLPGAQAAATAADADALIAFVVREQDLGAAEQAVAAARAGRLAWISYPRAASSGQTSIATGWSRPWPPTTCSLSARCPSTTPGPRCVSAPGTGNARHRRPRPAGHGRLPGARADPLAPTNRRPRAWVNQPARIRQLTAHGRTEYCRGLAVGRVNSSPRRRRAASGLVAVHGHGRDCLRPIRVDSGDEEAL